MIESFPKSKNKFEENFSPEELHFFEEKVQEMHYGALDEDDFRGKTYPDGFVDDCKNKVLEIKQGFEKNNTISEMKSELEENFGLSAEYRKVSEYIEALFYNKLGGKDGWIPNALIWKTSEYDDYINGIDFIVETENKELALGTDVTFSHKKSLENKLSKIKKAIDSGSLPQLVFYDSQSPEVRPLPRVIIAIERDKALKALSLWVDSEENESLGEILRHHPLRAKTLLEIEMQLESFATYAKNNGRREIASAYNDMLSQIQLLIIDHEETIKKYQDIIDDDVAYQAIGAFCENLKNTKRIEEE